MTGSNTPTAQGLANFFQVILLKALWGGQHRRPSIHARHPVAGRRKEACNTRSAIAGRGYHDDMSTTSYIFGRCGPRWRGAFFNKIATWARQKCARDTLNACNTSNNAKYGCPKRPTSRKCLFFQWILQNLRGNKWCKSGSDSPTWRARKAFFL